MAKPRTAGKKSRRDPVPDERQLAPPEATIEADPASAGSDREVRETDDQGGDRGAAAKGGDALPPAAQPDGIEDPLAPMVEDEDGTQDDPTEANGQAAPEGETAADQPDAAGGAEPDQPSSAAAPAQGLPRPPAQPKRPEQAVRRLWPALYSTKPALTAAEALPPSNVNMQPFLKARLPGPPGPTWAGRARSLTAHFRRLEPEFGGAPRLTHLLGCTIVALRRDPQAEVALRLFHRITKWHAAEVAPTLNLRWLAAVCDTFCDVGEPLDRATGLTGTTLANYVKLVETERRMFSPPRPWPPKAKFSPGGPLFDGVIAYWVGKGDLMDNMLRRTNAVLDANTSPAAPFLRETLARTLKHNTTLRRLISINDGRVIPPASPEQVAAAKAAMRDL